MSRPITPMSGAAGSGVAAPGSVSALGTSRPTSYMAADPAAADHAGQVPEYVTTDEVGEGKASVLQRAASQTSQSATYIPSRGGTLKKKSSLHKTGSLKRSGSRKSSYAGSVRSMRLGEKDKYDPEEYNSAFYCPIPTSSAPTELLANRFQAWRRVLKDLINYFRELHKSYESRSKTLLAASNMINNTSMPVDFLSSGGIGEAAEILRDFYKHGLSEANKSRDLENEVIMQLTGLRSDLSQKIKEIKSLSGDFKNSVHKEQDGTRKAVNAFQEALGLVDRDAEAASGKGDPFLMKLGVERQLERQIEEENYLHRAYLNLEASGRELESIVIGEIQKAYTVLAGILKRDADGGYDTAEKLKEGPLAMARDHEWDAFVTGNSHMVDPRQPLRQVKNISYEGKDHPAAIEVKSGMLERKSKYLKNYTPGWYILSPTHLHEFKSADQIPFQAPVMSLYLPEQKLGSHSEPSSSSHKFMLKGRQTGSMHRGHTWIFRAETHDTMMAWFADIRELTEKRGEARNEFVRRTHARTISGGSHRAASINSGDSQMAEDEADQVAFAGEESVRGPPADQSQERITYAAGGLAGSGILTDDRSEAGWRPPQRPQPGGRFPSDVNVTRGLQAPLSPSSGDSGDDRDRDAIAAAGALPGAALPPPAVNQGQPPVEQDQPTPSKEPTTARSPYTAPTSYTAGEHTRVAANPTGAEVAPETQSQYHEWIEATGAGVAGVGAGVVGAKAVQRGMDSSLEAREEPVTADKEVPVSESAISGHDQTTLPVPTAVTGARDSELDMQEPPRITASAYQAPTTLPLSAANVDFRAPNPTPSGSADPEAINGSLISGTDIRAPSGTAVHFSTESTTIASAAPLLATRVSPVPIPVSNATSTTSGAITAKTTDVDTDATFSSTTIRPNPVHTKSVQTISDLHIPGEFPKPAAKSSGPA